MFASLGNMSKLAKLVSVAALAGVSAGIYLLMKKWDSDWCTVVIEVPAEVAGRVIGRKGANIKLIEAKSQTKIKFEHADDSNKSDKRKCFIQGPLDSVGLAQSLLRASVESALTGPSVRHIEIPAEVAGGIVGFRGQNFKELKDRLGVNIRLEAKLDDPTRTTRNLTITGSKEGIAACEAAIREKVDHLLSKIKVATDRPAPKYRLQKSKTGHVASLESSCSPSEVLVSAVASPVTLYLQYASQNSSEFDRMIEAMMEFYSSSSGDAMALSHVSVGDMVAARGFNGVWYRARVVCVRQASNSKNLLGNSVKVPTEITNGLAENLSCENESKSEDGPEDIALANDRSKSEHRLLGNGILGEKIPLVSFDTQASAQKNPKYQNQEEETSEVPQKVTLAADEANTEVESSKSQIASEELNSNSPNTNSSSTDPTVTAESTICLVFFVDSGEYYSVALGDLRELRTDFLRLNHQAFKVQLARVEPVPEMWLAAEFELTLWSRKVSPGEITAKVVGYLHKEPVANGSVVNHVSGTIPCKPDTLAVLPVKEDTNARLRDVLVQLKEILVLQGHVKETMDEENFRQYVEFNGRGYLRMVDEKISSMEVEVFFFKQLMKNFEVLQPSSNLSNNNNNNNIAHRGQENMEYETMILKLLWKELTTNESKPKWKYLDRMSWSQVCSLIEDQHGSNCSTELSSGEVEQLESDIAFLERALVQLRWFDYLLRSAERLAFNATSVCDRPSEPVPLVRLSYTACQQVVDVSDELVKRGFLRVC